MKDRALVRQWVRQLVHHVLRLGFGYVTPQVEKHHGEQHNKYE